MFFHIPALEGLNTYRPDHTCGGPAATRTKKKKKNTREAARGEGRVLKIKRYSNEHNTAGRGQQGQKTVSGENK